MKRKIKYILVFLLVLPFIIVLASDYFIKQNAENKTYSDISLIKKNKVGLVLGTSKYLSSGQINLYFKYRIDATYELYKK